MGFDSFDKRSSKLVDFEQSQDVAFNSFKVEELVMRKELESEFDLVMSTILVIP